MIEFLSGAMVAYLAGGLWFALIALEARAAEYDAPFDLGDAWALFVIVLCWPIVLRMLVIEEGGEQ
jgi:hypothetical protein